MSNEMSETQRLVLQAGAAREDHLLLPRAGGAAAKAIAGKLVRVGWAREVKATKDGPIWRREAASGGSFALKLTAKGLRAAAESVERRTGSIGAEPVAEHTNASHTQLVDLLAANWSREIFQAAELDITCAPRIVPSGTLLGKLSGPLAALPGFGNTDLIAPACHDTASAIAGIAERGKEWAYISCGTWSLVGTLVPAPLNSPSVRADNFTNLGAVGGMTCFHKSINGLWILKQCMDHWADEGEPWNLVDLLRAADLEAVPADLLHVDDPALMGMGDMPSRINLQRHAKGLACLPEGSKDAPALVCLLLHSLAARYGEVIDRLRAHTDKNLRRIVMVGGGAQNVMLRRLTAERTGLEVITGPSESSTVGNLALQRAVLDGRSPIRSANFAEEVANWASRIAAAPSSQL